MVSSIFSRVLAIALVAAIASSKPITPSQAHLTSDSHEGRQLWSFSWFDNLLSGPLCPPGQKKCPPSRRDECGHECIASDSSSSGSRSGSSSSSSSSGSTSSSSTGSSSASTGSSSSASSTSTRSSSTASSTASQYASAADEDYYVGDDRSTSYSGQGGAVYNSDVSGSSAANSGNSAQGLNTKSSVSVIGWMILIGLLAGGIVIAVLRHAQKPVVDGASDLGETLTESAKTPKRKLFKKTTDVVESSMGILTIDASDCVV